MKSVQALIGSLFICLFSVKSMAVEEPKYAIIAQEKDFELRVYEPFIIAETKVSGTMKQASNNGFRVIADYIFGNNTMQTGESQKIAMTAPVTMRKLTTDWTVHFVMPSEMSMDSLPTPNNSLVVLREIPSRNYAVFRFSGASGESKVAEKTELLRAWMKKQGIEAKGSPELARYNPPWTPLFMRRNEIMIEY